MLNKGDKIGGYTLIKKVGSGGFGDVWKAEKRTALDVNSFALKFFRPKDDRIDFEKIGKELAVWKQLRGLPHIISVIELDRFDDYIYIVSDFADGGSLDNWIKDHGGKASSEAEAIKITLEILTGLENLHEKGFVHRDIKPDNILIMNGKHCLADFGVSREMKTHSKATGTAGTYEYMPPEAFGKNPSVPPQTDIWAVGVILQQLLTGQLPFSEEMPALMFTILQEPPEEMPENISEGLREIVKTALQKDRENRFQSAREMREALRNPKQFLAAKAKKEKDSGTIVDEDFDKDREIEAERQRQEEAARIRREAEEKERQQKIVEQEREKLLREMEAEKERQRLEEATATTAQSPENPVTDANPDSTEAINILNEDEKQNPFRALFNLKNKQLSVMIPISMWVLVGIFAGVISSRFLLKDDFRGNGYLLTNLLFIGFTLGIALYLFGEFSAFRPIRKKGKMFTSVFLTVANAIGCFAAFWLSLAVSDFGLVSVFIFGLIWGIFFVVAELLCWNIKLNKLAYSIGIIIFAGVSSLVGYGLAFLFDPQMNSLNVWLFWRIVLGQALVLLGHAVIFALIRKSELRDEAANAADGNKSELIAFHPPDEKNAIGAIGGIGAVLLILITISALKSSTSLPAENTNANLNTTGCPKFTLPANANSSVNLQPCKIGGYYGFGNSNGNLVISAIYDDADAFDANTGLARVRKGKWGYINSQGTVKIGFQYDEAERFYDGKARVTLNGETFAIDATGKRIYKKEVNFSQSATNTETSDSSLPKASCSEGTLNTGANLRSSSWVYDDNILSIWDKGAELAIIGITDGQAREQTGNVKWCKVKIKKGTCDSSKHPDCDSQTNGYIHADLISCN